MGIRRHAILTLLCFREVLASWSHYVPYMNTKYTYYRNEEFLIPARPGSLLCSSQDLVSIIPAEKHTNVDVDPASGAVVSDIISNVIQSIVTDMESHEDNINQNIPCSVSSTTNKSTLSDVFLYMCPFPDCDFHMETRVRKMSKYQVFMPLFCRAWSLGKQRGMLCLYIRLRVEIMSGGRYL